MRVTAIIIAWNEATIIPFAMRHYAAFCDDIVVFDHHSTDATAELVRRWPQGRVQEYDTGGVLRDDIHAHIKNDVHKNRGPYRVTPPVSGEWCIMVDADEFLYHPAIREYLLACADQGITVPAVQGYDMVSDALPDADDQRQLWSIIRHGIPYQNGSKCCCVHSDADIRYAPGAHCATIGGRVTGGTPRGQTGLSLLHYKWLAWPYVERKLRNLRLSPENRAAGWGTSLLDIEAQRVRYETMLRDRVEVLPPQ